LNLFLHNHNILEFSFNRWYFFQAVCLLSGNRTSSIIHRFTKKLLSSCSSSTSLLFDCTHKSWSCRWRSCCFLVRDEFSWIRELGHCLMMCSLIRRSTLFSVFLTSRHQSAMGVWVRIFNGQKPSWVSFDH
jgi:hypothetical protein